MCDMLIEAFEFLNDRQKLDEATPEFCFSMSVSPAMKNPKCSLRCVPRPATNKLNELLLANSLKMMYSFRPGGERNLPMYRYQTG